MRRGGLTLPGAFSARRGFATMPKPFLLERYFAKYEFTAQHQLCNSDCEALTLSELLPLMSKPCREMWDTQSFAYTETRGLPALREEIAKHYDFAMSVDNIQVLAPEEGIYLSMRCLIQPGDRVVATRPGYQSLTEVAQSMGAVVDSWDVTEAQDGFHFDVDALEKLLAGKQTKMLVVNFPHNPTGALPTQEEWKRIVDLARQHGAYLFSDEMYRMLERNVSDRLPSACTLYERGITLAGMSKAYSMPGLRIGWLATKDAAFLEQIATYRDYVTICSAGPAEILALAGLQAGEAVVRQNCERIASAAAAVSELLAEDERWATHFSWRQPKAGPITFLALQGSFSAESYCQKLVEGHGLLLLPSTLFGWGDKHVRIGLGRDSAKEVVDVWRAALRAGALPE